MAVFFMAVLSFSRAQLCFESGFFRKAFDLAAARLPDALEEEQLNLLYLQALSCYVENFHGNIPDIIKAAKDIIKKQDDKEPFRDLKRKMKLLKKAVRAHDDPDKDSKYEGKNLPSTIKEDPQPEWSTEYLILSIAYNTIKRSEASDVDQRAEIDRKIDLADESLAYKKNAPNRRFHRLLCELS